jgi:hypothetical protein
MIQASDLMIGNYVLMILSVVMLVWYIINYKKLVS